MKLAYVGSSAHNAVIKHSLNITLGVREGTEAVIVEQARTEDIWELPTLNTSKAIRAMLEVESIEKEFNELYGIKDCAPTTYLYGFIGEKRTSDFLEMTYSTHFMVGDVGPNVGFVKGTAIPAEDPLLAVPGLANLIEGLQGMGYRGEITIGINKGFEMCNVLYGTFIGGLALFNELSKGHIQDYYSFCVNDIMPGGLHKRGVAVVNLMSLPAFPMNLHVDEAPQYPPDAEPHLYRVKYQNVEVAYAAAWGTSIHEAKRRCRQTLENCTAVNPTLQYRVDYGHKEDFVINSARWSELGGVTAHRS